MRVKTKRIAAVIAILWIVLPMAARAAEPLRSTRSMFKGVELYSWINPGDDSWRYSICQGTNRIKMLVEITDACRVFHDVSSLKAYLAGLAVGESVFWSTPYPELLLPPQPMVRDLVEDSAAHQVRLLVLD